VHIHGFLTVNGEKMSKSRGTFILARDYAKLLNPDILRYYYAAKLSSSMDDIDFNLEDFVQRINSDVLGKFINIGSRIGAIVTKKLDGQLSTIDAEGQALLNDMLAMSDAISDTYQLLDTHKGMRMIMQCAELANKYIDDKAPWALVKNDAHAARVVCTAALNALRILCIYLAPVMPGVTQQLFSFLGVSPQPWAQLPQHITHATLAPYEHVLKRLTLDDVSPLVK
jgi:methionyl-tRNA synthetase